ncbi:MAG: phosphotriesterase [Acidimicrobiia bacterium]
MAIVTTATGPVDSSALGATLMHEHLVTSFGGWQSDFRSTAPSRVRQVAEALDRIAELQDAGITAMVDPCPIDLGRAPELAAELSAHTGFKIVLATGLYLDNMAAGHWKMVARSGGARYLADAFIHDITVGMEGTDVKAGIIKVATGTTRITGYEKIVLEAAAIASNETNTPITTHTDRGQLGDEQQAILTGHGVPPHRIVIGHSCGSTDHDYHLTIARGGSYLGFDRFGLEREVPDDKRLESLWRLMSAGYGDRLVVSQDTVWCWPGEPPGYGGQENWHVLRFVRDLVPKLLALGAGKDDIDTLLRTNPKRYFDGEPLG